MAARLQSSLASAATRALGVRPRHLERHRVVLNDGAATTVHVATHDLRRTVPRVVRLPAPTPLERWCRDHGVAEAIVGGFFVRPVGTPLGELRTSGIARAALPFDAPWGDVRGCLHVVGGHVALARRDELPAAPAGDLLQAGPLLVEDGRIAFDGASDAEGFSAASEQFDSDITDGRHPRAAIGVGDGHVTVAVCDGRRSRIDDGLTMPELAQLMRELGCHTAMNLDGGGSTTLVHRGHLLNRPYSEQDQPAPASRPIVTALLLS
jgi:uncharacterized protein YigE (DUF2233 family)